MRIGDILSAYASGFCEIAFAACGVAIAVLMTMQVLAQVSGLSIDAEGILRLTWEIVVLLALWPGQTFWTIRRMTADGFEHSVIGVPSDDDLRVMNHQAARRIRSEMRD